MDIMGYIRYAIWGIPRDIARAVVDLKLTQVFLVLNLLGGWILVLFIEHDFLLLRAGSAWGNGLFLLAAAYTSYLLVRIIGAVFYAYGVQENLECESRLRIY